MADVIKPWDAFELLAVPRQGAALAPAAKKGRAVSAGQILARYSDSGRGSVTAPVNGRLLEINEWEIVIQRDESAVGEPPQVRGLESLTAPELAAALTELGVDIPLPPDGDFPVIVNTLDAEPGYNFSAALFTEHRETMLAGIEVIRRLQPGRKIIWAVKEIYDEDDGPTRFAVSQRPYPACLPSVLKKDITGQIDRVARGVLDGRSLYALGRAWRTGLPVGQMVLTLGGVNYFVPIGSRIIDLLNFANLRPTDGEKVVAGGLVRGRTVTRLDRGLGKDVAALHLHRSRRENAPAEPCRRCGSCTRACPVGIKVDAAARLAPKQWLVRNLEIYKDCLLCGACTLACPVGRPLMSLARLNVKDEF